MNNRRRDIIGMTLVSLVFALGFYALYSNQTPMLSRVDAAYESGDALNLSPDIEPGRLAQFLISKGYLTDSRDARLIADSIVEKMDGKPLKNLGTLNTPAFQISAQAAEAYGGEDLKARVLASQKKLEYDSSIDPLYSSLPPSRLEQAGGTKAVRVAVAEDKQPVKGVVVRLREHYYVTEKDSFDQVIGRELADSVVGYASTGDDGNAEFVIHEDHFYSFLPIRKGYEYGRTKGTTRGEPLRSVIGFTQKPHKITMLGGMTYAKIKQDQSLTVRTPSAYKDRLIFAFALFLVVWWGVYMVINYAESKIRKQSDHLVIIILMTLTGIGLLSMFAISNPLTDLDNGGEMSSGLVMGGVALLLFSAFDYVKYYNGGSILKFDYLERFAPQLKGLGFVLLALVLVVMVWRFGYAPEGSDAKVNLRLPGFTFQPSELSKYLIVFFIASFFAMNARRIQAFSSLLSQSNLRQQLKTVGVILVVMVVLIGLYVVLLSDMGPALVLLVTFILLYSVARNDTIELFVGVATFIAMLMAGRTLHNSVAVDLIVTFVWFAGWVAVNAMRSRRLYESAIFMNVVVFAFVVGGGLLKSMGMSEGQRLLNRTAMSGAGVWANDVPGGDQIAQGIWSLATGGLTGQGLGKGNPNLVPACTTDMVMSSIGEMMGWVTLVLVILCLAVLLHRSLLLARRAGNPFAFFLLSGIAIVTGVQFFVISLGSLGIIPLTGVAVPFLSFGKSSLIINMAAFGVILSLSRVRATRNQVEAIKKYDNVVAMGSVAFILLGAVVVGTLFYYQVMKRDTYIIKNAYITNTNGEFECEPNPRIRILERKLLAGNIYDRNGLLLATSSPDSLQASRQRLVSAGVESGDIDALRRYNRRRYYPFGDHMLFMVGDMNTGTVRDNSDTYPTGYVAEYRHLSRLRGYDNLVRDVQGKVVKDKFVTEHYHESPFVTDSKKTFYVTRRDYTPLLEMLKSGNDSRLVDEWNRRQMRTNLSMTVDARLQMALNRRMERDVRGDAVLNGIVKFRASVVVLNASTGELLCSSNYPMPNQDTIRAYPTYTEKNKSQRAWTPQDLGTTYLTQPGSTAKVASALAAFMKLGPSAAQATYQIYSGETIGHDGVGMIGMPRAIPASSNTYFVNLVHDKRVYPQLDTIYHTFGGMINNGNYGAVSRPVIPYYYYQDDPVSTRDEYSEEMRILSEQGYAKYDSYVSERSRTRKYQKMNWSQLGIAWGQHHIHVSPLTMARLAATVCNNGVYCPTKILMEDNFAPVRMVSSESAALLQSFMRTEGAKHKGLPAGTGGKTGTPARGMVGVKRKGGINDGWYICFTSPTSGEAPLAIALRLERIGLKGMNSGRAVKFMENTIIPVLRELNYVR